jgi:putative aldouronate transport system permease protein
MAEQTGKIQSLMGKGRFLLLQHKLLKQIWKNRALYIFVLPMTVYFFTFHLAPLYGLQIAFKEFKPALGIFDSPWAGFKYIEKFVSSFSFWNLLRNTLTLSFYCLVITIPFSIILALLVNYTPFARLKKLTQTISYAPHFISMVVLVGMMNVFFMPGSGVVNIFLGKLGIPAIDFMGNPKIFPHLYAWSRVWSHTGYSAILYIATLTGVSPELHEAAIADGANKIQRIFHIDIPAILPTAIIILIMESGNLLNVGFEKAFLMQTPGNLTSSEIISTYVYKVGLLNTQYSYAAAIGLFNNVINCIILLIVNHVSRKTTENSLW